MGKISKYSNLYKDNVLIRSVNDKGVLEKYTLKEVQDLVDKLGTEKDENGRIKDQEGFNNASYILMQMYNDPKYNDEKENFIKELNDRLRVNKEDVGRSLEELDRETTKNKTTEVSIVTESEGVRIPEQSRIDKERGNNNINIESSSNERVATMYKKCIEDEKEFSKRVLLKSYDVNNNKEEYVEYKKN